MLFLPSKYSDITLSKRSDSPANIDFRISWLFSVAKSSILLLAVYRDGKSTKSSETVY